MATDPPACPEVCASCSGVWRAQAEPDQRRGERILGQGCVRVGRGPGRSSTTPPVSQDSRPLEILFFSAEYPPDVMGGVSTHLSQMAQGLAAAGHRATVIAYTVGAERTLRERNLTVHLTPVVPKPASQLQLLVQFNQIAVERTAALVREGYRPDALFFFDWFFLEGALSVRKLFNVPFGACTALLVDPCFRWWGDAIYDAPARQERRLCEEADGLVASSESIRQLLREHRAVPEEKISVVYPCMDMRPFEAVAARRPAWSEQEKVIFFAGRLALQKGISALLASAAQVVRAEPTTRYVLVGPDRWRPADPASEKFQVPLEQTLAADPLLASRVELTGMLPREEVIARYGTAHLAVVPSIYEPFGYAASEACAAGVPVVATAVGGLQEIVADGETGLLVPVLKDREPHRVDVDALTAAQLRLLRDGALAERLGRAGRARVLAKFGVEQMTRGMEDFLRKLLRRFHARP